MILEELTQDGRKKIIERVMFARCLFCGGELRCPSQVEPWEWVKSGGASDFLSEHLRHAPSKAIGFQVEFLEKE